MDSTRRLLFVHAHPDDETINSGATMAAAVAAGAALTLVTCTRGELGEVVPDELAHLRGDPDALGAHRETELAAAMARLGVTDHRFLGAASGTRYRDSGMVTLPGGTAGTPSDLDARAFAAADLDAAAAQLAAIVEEVRPHALLTYEAGGGYGHPDHVMAHRVALGALELSSWQVPKVYASVIPRSLVLAHLESLGPAVGGGFGDGPLPSMMVADDEITTVVAAADFHEAKIDALAAHRSQITVDREAVTATGDDGFAQPILAIEWYALLRGQRTGPLDADGRETTVLG